MAKKNLSGGINSLLGDQTEKKQAEESASKKGTKPGETRATFIVKEEDLDKLKAIAYWERLLIKDVVEDALLEAIKNYERKNGAIKPIPKR